MSEKKKTEHEIEQLRDALNWLLLFAPFDIQPDGTTRRPTLEEAAENWRKHQRVVAQQAAV